MSISYKTMNHLAKISSRLILCLVISGTTFFAATTTIAQVEVAGNVAPQAVDAYKLGAGDRLKIVVFGEESLSGEFEIDGQGMVALPLIGNLQGGGLDVRSFEKDITAKLKAGYLINPRVSIEVLNFRPFFILGEIKNPGSYPYVNGLTVLNAIALAGGYTHRARTDRVLVRHGNDATGKEFALSEDAKVMPGDALRVTERFF